MVKSFRTDENHRSNARAGLFLRLSLPPTVVNTRNRPLFFALLSFVAAVAWRCGGSEETSSKGEPDGFSDEKLVALFGALPQTANAPADNPTTPEKVELGRLLFYDPILSGQKDVACATCHHPEFGYAESLEISIGANGHGFGSNRVFADPNDVPFTKRNAHTVVNAAFNGITADGTYDPAKAPMFWDLRSESLEKQALEPIKSFEEMRGHPYQTEAALDSAVARLRAIAEYRQQFKTAFGTETITPVEVGKALAAFQRTLIAPNSRFDQYARGDKSALSELEKEGMLAFVKSGCAECHRGPMFSDFKLHALGVADNEKLAESDAGKDGRYAFRTPTLRNLRHTAPYMHSGKLPGLQQVLEFYEDLSGNQIANPHVTPAMLDPLVAKKLRLEFRDIQAIIAFLDALNDDDFDKRLPERVPSGLPVGGNLQ